MSDQSTIQVEYRPVVGFSGYRVGDDGGVWSCWRNGGNDRTSQMTETWHLLRGWIDKRRGKQEGYVKIGLMREGILHRVRLHKVVLEAFVGPCPDGLQCRHLDDVKTNNHRSNLCWGTVLENADDRGKNGLTPSGEDSCHAVLTKDEVFVVLSLLARGWTRRAIAQQFKVNHSAINSIHAGRSWKEVSRDQKDWPDHLRTEFPKVKPCEPKTV